LLRSRFSLIFNSSQGKGIRIYRDKRKGCCYKDELNGNQEQDALIKDYNGITMDLGKGISVGSINKDVG